MKLNLFTLCEGAFNHNGHLTIVNTIDFINCEELPYRVAQFGVAAKIYFDAAESGEHLLKLICKNVMGEETVMIETPIVVAQAVENTLLCVSANLSNFQFSANGIHLFRLLVDDVAMGELILKVNLKSKENK